MPVYRDEQCAKRGPGLTHTQDGATRPDGSCIHCHALVDENVLSKEQCELLFERPAVVPSYLTVRAAHGQQALVAYRSHRPLLSIQHAWSARVLTSAGIAEHLDPPPPSA